MSEAVKCDLCDKEVFCTCGCNLCKEHYDDHLKTEKEDGISKKGIQS